MYTRKKIKTVSLFPTSKECSSTCWEVWLQNVQELVWKANIVSIECPTSSSFFLTFVFELTSYAMEYPLWFDWVSWPVCVLSQDFVHPLDYQRRDSADAVPELLSRSKTVAFIKTFLAINTHHCEGSCVSNSTQLNQKSEVLFKWHRKKFKILQQLKQRNTLYINFEHFLSSLKIQLRLDCKG